MKKALETFFTIALIAIFIWLAVHFGLKMARPTELRGAWTIVKQHGIENYGYITELGYGFVIAGFTNKQDAVKAMQESRYHHRNPPKQENPKSMWENQ